MISREEDAFVPSTYSIVGAGNAHGCGRDYPVVSQDDYALPYKRMHMHKQWHRHRQAQAFISENKTNCNKARRGDYEHLLRGKSTARRSRHQNRLGRRFPAPSNGPTKIVKSIIAQDRKSFYPSKAALRYGLDNLYLTRCCFWAWEGGQSTEYATYWQGDSLGWLHRSGVATACNALQQRSSFSCRFVYPNTPPPNPRSSAAS
jgi:hypothetical protein